MYVFEQLAIGIVIAHALWALCFITGSTLDDPKREVPDLQGPAMFRFVSLTVCGIAMWSFEGFFLGTFHLLTPLGIGLALACNLIAMPMVRGDSIFSRPFWQRRALLICRAMRGAGGVVYVCALILIVPAVIPDFSDDGVRVHLAYAYDWARIGRIYAELRMRFPYYAFNAELLYAWMMVAGIGRYIPFFGWLAGTLACMGIEGLAASIDAERQATRSGLARRAAGIVYVAAAWSLMLSAVFLRWWPTAMTDALAAATFLTVVGACVMAMHEEDATWLPIVVIACGFLAGMKPSYLFFVPLTAIAIGIVATRLHVGRRTIVALVACLLVLASPWYARNFVRDGDPIPPIFNLTLRGSDPIFTKQDWEHIQSDLQSPRSAADWIAFPIQEWRNPQVVMFREYGVTGVVIWVYPIALAGMIFLAFPKDGKPRRALLFLSAVIAFGILYFLLTSALTRYTLLIYPEIAAGAAILIVTVTDRIRYGGIAAVALAATMLIPSPGSRDFYHRQYALFYRQLAAYVPNEHVILNETVPGYEETAPILNDPVLRQREYNRVLLIHADMQYYAELAGAQPVGDYSGPERYSDLAAAIDEDRAAEYFRRHRIGAVVASWQGSAIVPEETAFLKSQLESDGFSAAPSSDMNYLVMVKRAGSKKTPASRSHRGDAAR